MSLKLNKKGTYIDWDKVGVEPTSQKVKGVS